MAIVLTLVGKFKDSELSDAVKRLRAAAAVETDEKRKQRLLVEASELQHAMTIGRRS